MKKLLLSLPLLLLLSPCGIGIPTRIRAVYFVHSPGQLSRAELNQHPEIFVTSSSTLFQSLARQRIGLWVDKNVLPLDDSSWFDQMPQASYPIIVIGYGDGLHAFRDGLSICCFAGPATDYPAYDNPGFSVILRASGEIFAPSIEQTYKQVPHVDDILRINNDLLDGKILPSPTVPPPNLPSPTLP